MQVEWTNNEVPFVSHYAGCTVCPFTVSCCCVQSCLCLPAVAALLQVARIGGASCSGMQCPVTLLTAAVLTSHQGPMPVLPHPVCCLAAGVQPS